MTTGGRRTNSAERSYLSAEEFQGWGPHGRCIITWTDLIFGCLRPRTILAETRLQPTCRRTTGTQIPFDIAVAGCIPSVYQHLLLLMRKFGIKLIDTRFSDI